MSDKKIDNKELFNLYSSLRAQKPRFPIATPIKPGAGILALVFAMAFIFVLREENQKWLAFFIMIPFSITFIYFLYLWLRDNQAVKAYRSYLNNIQNIAILYPDYKNYQNNSWGLLGYTNTSELTQQKNMAGVLSVLMLFATVIAQSQASRLTPPLAFLFILMIMSFIYLNNMEVETIEKEIHHIENWMETMKW